MNGLGCFRFTTLSDEKLIDEIDNQTDNMFKNGKVPTIHTPARPDKDYDILIGELLQRFMELKVENKKLKCQTTTYGN